MRLTLSLALCATSAFALAACSPQPGNTTVTNATTTETTASETAVNETVPTASSERNEPATDADAAPLTPPAPGTPGGLPDDRTPISEAPQPAESAQGAATVVETYYALIGEGKYGQAWALWENGGRASGMSRADFAASFTKYSEYRAQVGAPGRIDAGAGQRYVQVPVVVYGRLKDGKRPFNMKGSMTLHRTDVDGATAEQKSWRIRAAEIKPRPGDPAPQPTVDNRSTARYRCMDGTKLSVQYDPDNRRATAIRAGKTLAVMQSQRVASGIAYAGGGYELRAKGSAMTFTAPDLPPIACTIIN
jgi:membrane-bound inhibitor of C-type lysozyme